jgi:hypothetical protein
MSNRSSVVVALLFGIVVGAAGHSLLTKAGRVEVTDPVASTSPPGDQSRPVGTKVTDTAMNPAESLHEIPISLNYVEARTGRGYVVQFHNQSQKHLAVMVELKNKTVNQRKSGPLQFAPGQLVEIGGTPDWTFVSGETVTLKLDGYRTKTFQIP